MKNFLFLAIDDLNDWVGGLDGYSGTVHTPNIDRLITQSTTFSNAFSQAAICNPSRASVLTGKAPQETGIFNNFQYNWQAKTPAQETLFGVFKEAGYYSEGVGKLWHTGTDAEATAVMFDRYQYLGKDQTGVNIDGKPAGPYDGTDPLKDEVRTDYVVDFLNDYTPDGETPLLLSVGLLKPHTDWVVPRAFFDLYPLDEIRIDATPGDTSDIPQFVRDVAGQAFPWDHASVPDETQWKQLIQAYLASISFVDHQVGKILNALEASQIADNTAVVVWSDHGYHLGDKDLWHKFTLWDNAARAPLIIRDPGAVPEGETVDDPVELLDIFPTMLDMAGIPDTGLALGGKSLVPYFNGSAPAGEAQAFTWMYGNVSIRTAEYRYSLYEDGSVELYDVANDPELLNNIADQPAHAATEAMLRDALTDKFNLVGYGTAGNLAGSAEDDVFADTTGVRIEGGDGDDIYFVTPDSLVVERAQNGRDTIITAAQTYRLPPFVEDLEVTNWSQLIYGNQGSNLITAAPAMLYALGGNDTVQTASRAGAYDLGPGDDVILSQSGADTIWGGDGNDLITSGAGNDQIYGGAGDDTVTGGDGDDYIEGGSGNDRLLGNASNDTLYGNDGDDTLFGVFGSDLLDGGDGDDVLGGGTEADTLFGGAGRDSLRGDGGDDYLSGGDGDDSLSGGADNDDLFGDAGNDTLEGNLGHDDLDGGADRDLLSGGPDNDRLAGGTEADTLYGDGGNDTLLGNAGFDLLSGGNGNDDLDGGDQADNLYGGFGNDHIRGGAGLDHAFGGLGNDVIEGGAQNDWLFGELGEDTLYGDAGFDVLSGGDDADLLDGGAQADNLFGGFGDDTLRGGDGFDRLFAGLGDDVLSGGDGPDALFGEYGDDTLNGEADTDRLWGGFGNDLLDGGAQDDRLSGDVGFDTLVGGAGNDTLIGGYNADVFVFADISGGFGTDIIEDFAATNPYEKIDVSGIAAITDYADLRAAHIVQVGADVVIDTLLGSSVRLIGTDMSDLDQTDFLF